MYKRQDYISILDVFLQVSIENFEKELSALDERKQAVQAVQRLKQKQIALIMQSVADVQATVDEVWLLIFNF